MTSKIVNGIYHAFAKGDVPAVLLDAFHSEVEWWQAESFLYADGNPYLGSEAVAKGVFQRLATDVDNLSVDPENVIDAGETIAVEGQYRGQ